MSETPSFDITVRRGNNVPVLFRFKDAAGDPVDLAGSEFQLRAVWAKNALEWESPGAGLSVNAAAGEVLWSPTIADTRALPKGRIARYELERRLPGGEQRTLLTGYLIGEGGIADD